MHIGIVQLNRRFEDHGVVGLDARMKGDEPRTVTLALEAKFMRKAARRPDNDSTR